MKAIAIDNFLSFEKGREYRVVKTPFPPLLAVENGLEVALVNEEGIIDHKGEFKKVFKIESNNQA